ncbi:hypothetical protein D2E22_1380 [Bifidobacterium castoris]|uniref:Peptide ABC transporter permease n=2 Tax=Bifidobacterium castoris TaxID=2306972 RepID=A0A430F685_9BIFI|nr:hypothetical protein D2E22_1380 [Bifidobacterium castoris]
MSKRRRAMYRKRRLVFFAGLLVFLIVCVLCVYSLIRGAVAAHDWIGAADRMAVSRSAVPAPPQTSKVKDCTAKNLQMTLTPAADVVPLGGSLEFTATMTYVGSDPAGCFVDGADDSRVLVIKSGEDTVWRSDACEATYRPLLMMEGVTDEQKIVWDTVRSGDECKASADLPHVDRGSYTAQLVIDGDTHVESKSVAFTVG